MSDLFRPNPNLLMSPITGIRPTDDRWGGEVVEEHLMAIYEDVMNSDVPSLLKTVPDDALMEDVIGMVVLQTAVRTAQRLAVELDGCTIDTSTIFEDDVEDLMEDGLGG